MDKPKLNQKTKKPISKKRNQEMKTHHIKIQFQEYNNKSRKGLYLTLKTENAPSRSYKFEGRIGEADAIRQYYQDKYQYKTEQQKSLKKYKNAFELRTSGTINRRTSTYINKIKKEQKPIEEQITKGISFVKIQHAHETNNGEVRKALTKLLEPVVYDKELIQILVLPENIAKIKHRLELKLEIKNEKDETFAVFNKFNESPYVAITELKNTIPSGIELEHKHTPELHNRLKNNKWIHIQDYPNNGKLKNSIMTITFRKGWEKNDYLWNRRRPLRNE